MVLCEIISVDKGRVRAVTYHESPTYVYQASLDTSAGTQGVPVQGPLLERKCFVQSKEQRKYRRSRDCSRTRFPRCHSIFAQTSFSILSIPNYSTMSCMHTLTDLIGCGNKWCSSQTYSHANKLDIKYIFKQEIGRRQRAYEGNIIIRYMILACMDLLFPSSMPFTSFQ